MDVTITNWPDLVDQFGYEKSRELLQKLCTEVAKRKTEDEWENLSVEYAPEKTEAIALFVLVKRTKEFPSRKQTLRYEYRGTTN